MGISSVWFSGSERAAEENHLDGLAAISFLNLAFELESFLAYRIVMCIFVLLHINPIIDFAELVWSWPPSECWDLECLIIVT